ncbi:MAG: glutamyl-tRNA synthetase, partial [Clostridium butyricum]|nr:glutamyl-tRNA synthetase [Clostridium butyricum]
VDNILKEAIEVLDKVDDFNLVETEKAYRDLIEKLDIKSGDLFHPTRLAISGRTFGPGLFDIMELLGKEKTIGRIKKAIKYIENLKGE